MCISVPSGRRVYLFFLDAHYNMHSWDHDKLTDRQTDSALTEIDKNGGLVKVRILLELEIL